MSADGPAEGAIPENPESAPSSNSVVTDGPAPSAKDDREGTRRRGTGSNECARARETVGPPKTPATNVAAGGRMNFNRKVSKAGTRVSTSQDLESDTLGDDVTRKVIQTNDGFRKLAAIAASIRTAINTHDQLESRGVPGPQDSALGQADSGGAPHTGTGSNTSTEKEEP